LLRRPPQVIVQKVREAERAHVIEQFNDRMGTMVSVWSSVDRSGDYRRSG
jgi:hypothetical protein